VGRPLGWTSRLASSPFQVFMHERYAVAALKGKIVGLG
jgi:hypothetical protein